MLQENVDLCGALCKPSQVWGHRRLDNATMDVEQNTHAAPATEALILPGVAGEL
jgi:hypothetical protein